MGIHIQSIDWRIWGMIKNDYTPFTKMIGEKVVSKPRFEWDDKDFALANLKSKAVSCIINGLTCNEFHKIMNITFAKKM